MSEIIKKLQYIETQIKDPILAGQVREVEYIFVRNKDVVEFYQKQIEAMNEGMKALQDEKDILYKLIREKNIILPCKLSCHYGSCNNACGKLCVHCKILKD